MSSGKGENLGVSVPSGSDSEGKVGNGWRVVRGPVPFQGGVRAVPGGSRVVVELRSSS